MTEAMKKINTTEKSDRTEELSATEKTNRIEELNTAEKTNRIEELNTAEKTNRTEESFTTEKLNIEEESSAVKAYFDLEFCNDRTSHQNFPIAIGVSYRQGEKEIAFYESLIRCSDEVTLWTEQLEEIGYNEEELRLNGKYIETVEKELVQAHKKYRPTEYISFGRQDEDLLKKHTSDKLSAWKFCDAIAYLPQELGMKYDISLEKYAYICDIEFVHQFEPLEDARALAEIVYHVQKKKIDEERRAEVSDEYDRKMFVIRYRDRERAYDYLNGLSELTPKQREKRKNHMMFLKKNKKQYLEYLCV